MNPFADLQAIDVVTVLVIVLGIVGAFAAADYASTARRDRERTRRAQFIADGITSTEAETLL